MANSFYNHSSGVPATQTRGSSLNIREELDLIEDGFDAVETNPTFNGLVTLAGGQAKFPATQSASADANTLDDYEEGDWTPTFSSTGSTFSYNTRAGRYIKIGKKVTVWGGIILNGSGNTLSANTLTVTGLPYNATSSGPNNLGIANWQALARAYSMIWATAFGTYISLTKISGAGVTATSAMVADDLSPTSSSFLQFCITYEAVA